MRKHLIIVMAAAAGIVCTASARASAEHLCRQGDPPIYASAATTCGLAGDIVTDYVNVCRESHACSMRVHVASAPSRYRIACRRTGARHTGVVLCTGVPATGIWARFSADI
jgi:hypothetical protein